MNLLNEEVLAELKKIVSSNSSIEAYILELLKYEDAGGIHWKKEYVELAKRYLSKNNTDQNEN